MFNAITGPQSDEFSEVNILEGLEKEATPVIPSQDLLQAYLAHFDMDNFVINGYIEEVNALLELSISAPPWIMKYEQMPPPSITPIAPLLEAPPTLEQKPLLVMLKDPFLEPNATSDQKAQIVDIQKEYELVREIITDLIMDYPTRVLS